MKFVYQYRIQYNCPWRESIYQSAVCYSSRAKAKDALDTEVTRLHSLDFNYNIKIKKTDIIKITVV